jgi:hypothetical protein
MLNEKIVGREKKKLIIFLFCHRIQVEYSTESSIKLLKTEKKRGRGRFGDYSPPKKKYRFIMREGKDGLLRRYKVRVFCIGLFT